MQVSEKTISNAGFVLLFLVQPVYLVFSEFFPSLLYLLIYTIGIPIFLGVFFLFNVKRQHVGSTTVLIQALTVVALLTTIVFSGYSAMESSRIGNAYLTYLSAIFSWSAYFFVGYYVAFFDSDTNIVSRFFHSWSFWIYLSFLMLAYLAVGFGSIEAFILGYYASDDISVLALSELVLLLVAFKVGLLAREGRLLPICFLILLQALFYSRTAFVALIVAVCAYMLMNRTDNVRWGRVGVGLAVVALGITIVSQYVPLIDSRQLSWIFETSMLTSLYSRLEIMGTSLAVLANSPFVGAPFWQIDSYTDIGYYSHSFISYYAQFGVIAFSIVLFLFFRSAYWSVRFDSKYAIGLYVFIFSAIASRSFVYAGVWFFIGASCAEMLAKRREKIDD